MPGCPDASPQINWAQIKAQEILELSTLTAQREVPNHTSIEGRVSYTPPPPCSQRARQITLEGGGQGRAYKWWANNAWRPPSGTLVLH